MGEGGDGGESFGETTPTFVLPRTQGVPGGGENFGVGFKRTGYEPTDLEPGVVQSHSSGVLFR